MKRLRAIRNAAFVLLVVSFWVFNSSSARAGYYACGSEDSAFWIGEETECSQPYKDALCDYVCEECYGQYYAPGAFDAESCYPGVGINCWCSVIVPN